jgi:hypothetical protein
MRHGQNSLDKLRGLGTEDYAKSDGDLHDCLSVFA